VNVKKKFLEQTSQICHRVCFDRIFVKKKIIFEVILCWKNNFLKMGETVKKFEVFPDDNGFFKIQNGHKTVSSR